MNILELAILKKMVGGGGGSGTNNYNDLLNLPQINGETLAGNKTAANLGLQDALTFDSVPTEDSTNPVESGGVYNALAGKQDNLTFDDDPTENSTNPVKSGGVYNALAGKQDNLTFDGVYNASTNKAATESTVTNAIAGLDVSAYSVDADETISSISETDGKISVNKQNIAIASSQVVAMTGYTKPSSAPATPAIQQGDTANEAIGKLEYKADVNQTNILYGLNTGVKNKLPCQISEINQPNDTGLTCIYNKDGTYTVTGTKSTSDAYLDIVNIFADNLNGDHTAYISVTGTGTCNIAAYGWNGTGYTLMLSTAASQNFNIGNYAHALFRIRFMGSVGASFNATIKIMVCTLDAWNQSHDWQPPALPNYDLTRLEAEDRASLAEVVDSGAKNLVDLSSFTGYSDGSLTMTKASDGTITVTGTVTGSFVGVNICTITLTPGTYVLTGCPEGGGVNTWQLDINTGVYEDRGNGVVFTVTSTMSTVIRIRIATTSSSITKVFKPMLCTKAAFDVSQKFVPYRPNWDLVASRLPICKYVDTSVSSSYSLISSLLCTITEPGFYRITATQNYYNVEPRGLIISDSYSEYSSYHAFSKTEVSERVNNLSTSFTIYAVSSNFYIWAKGSTSGTNRITLTVERLG